MATSDPGAMSKSSMMKVRHSIRSWATVTCALLLGTSTFATHLVGGNVGYNYIGETTPGSGMYRYEVYLEFFMNCGPNSNWQSLYQLLGQDYGTPLVVGAYIQDPNDPNADKVKYTDVNVFLSDSLVIEPDLPDNCTVGSGLCAIKGRFVGTVDLPLNFGGYHLYYQMCCRNLDIDNINNPNGTGIGYYAFVPPPLVNNSSPTFLGVPIPFLCTSDTTTFLNTATDPDGDQLIFSFETPYNSVQFGGGIIPPPAQLPWPVPEVTYNAGFGVSQPFGTGGYSYINGATGLTQYQAPVQGNYVVAVEVKEYRNGQLIGRTRRDLQLQVIPCPPNNTPAVSGVINQTYSVQAGDQLCFDMSFNDVDGDSLMLVANGAIFDGNLYNPAATITSPVEGLANVTSTFCWNTSCDQGQDQPYLFSVSVSDNGCPPKTVDVVVQIDVQPFEGPDQITGPVQVCTGSVGMAYSAPNIAGATYDWSVTGGTITGGNGTSNITVDWGQPGQGVVSVFATNQLNCASVPVELNVTVVPLPSSDAGPDVTICAGAGTAIGGSPTGPAGSTYDWAPATGLSSTTAANPTATPTTSTTYVVHVTNMGCSNSDTMTVTLSLPSISPGSGATICVGDTAQLNATGIGDFSWSPGATLTAPDIPDPQAFPTASTFYTVTLTDSIGCIVSDSVLVNVNPLPVVNAGVDTTICTNTDLVLGGSPTGPSGSIFTWSPANAVSDPSAANPTTTLSATTNFTVVVTDGNTCTDSASVTVSVLQAAAADAGPDLGICPGDSVQLLASGSGTISWSPGTGLSDSLALDPFAMPMSTTTYTLTVNDGSPCLGTDMVTLTVYPEATANAGQDLAICLGDTVQLNATGGGTYGWSPANGLSDANAGDPLAFPSTTTVYVLTVNDTNSCSAVDTLVIAVNQPAHAGTDGGTTVCSSDGPIDLFTLLGGNPDGGGTWTPTDTYVPGGGGGTFTYAVTPQAPCPVDTAVVSIIENVAPNAGTDASLDLCTADAPVDLLTVLGGTPDQGGTWTDPNNDPFNGVFDPALWPGGSVCVYEVPGLAPCANDQAVVSIQVSLTPNAGINTTTSTCGSGVIFDMLDSLAGGPSSGGVWTDPNGDPHPGTFDPATDDAGIYTYTLGTDTTCMANATLTVGVIVPPADAGVDMALCIGDTVQLNATGGAGYAWSPMNDLTDPGIADPQAFPQGTTMYTVLVTDSLGCIASDSLTITVNALPVVDAGPDGTICALSLITIGGAPTGPAGSQYDWSPSAGLDDATSANPQAGPVGNTTYVVEVTDVNGCINADTVVVHVNALPVIDAGADTTVCLGLGVQLSAQGNGTFTWDPSTGLNDPNIADPIASPGQSTTYVVTITDTNSCTSSDTVNVTVNALPTADAGPDLWVCPGSSVQLQGAGGTSYAWSPGATLSDPNSATPLASPASTTVFTLTVTDDNGCNGSDQTTVTVNDDPPIDAGPDQGGCAGDPFTLGGNPSSIPGSSFLWTPATGLDDPNAPNPVATPTVTTTYTLIVSNDTCTSSDQVLITVSAGASPAFNLRLEPGCDGLRGYFTDLSTGADTYFWDFGDGGTSTLAQPEHQFNYGGDITVTLQVTDVDGCTTAITQTYTAGELADHTNVIVPNVFTPNGDGDNDLFTPMTDAILGPCTDMFVYNRWGEKVFESLGNDIVWDGRTFAGVNAIPGTYFYVITVNGMTFKGTVLLNR